MSDIVDALALAICAADGEDDPHEEDEFSIPLWVLYRPEARAALALLPDLIANHPATVETAAKALYEGGDQFGRPSNVSWEEMLTYGGAVPDNKDHPLADQYRRMARDAIQVALIAITDE